MTIPCDAPPSPPPGAGAGDLSPPWRPPPPCVSFLFWTRAGLVPWCTSPPGSVWVTPIRLSWVPPGRRAMQGWLGLLVLVSFCDERERERERDPIDWTCRGITDRSCNVCIVFCLLLGWWKFQIYSLLPTMQKHHPTPIITSASIWVHQWATPMQHADRNANSLLPPDQLFLTFTVCTYR